MKVTIGFHDQMAELTKDLLPILPGYGRADNHFSHSSALNTLFYTNSGAEAVENAIKLARHATKKQNIIVFQGTLINYTLYFLTLMKVDIMDER